MATEWVRVSRPHGHFTVTRQQAERGGWKVLKSAAVDEFGRPLPAKLRASIDEASKTPRRKSRRGDPTHTD